MSDAPDHIWLQWEAPYGENTFAEDKINDDDVKYVRADHIEALEAERDLQTERLRLAIERAEKAEDERDTLRAELRGLWEARTNRSGPMVDTILGVPLEDIFEKIICVAEEDVTVAAKVLMAECNRRRPAVQAYKDSVFSSVIDFEDFEGILQELAQTSTPPRDDVE